MVTEFLANENVLKSIVVAQSFEHVKNPLDFILPLFIYFFSFLG